MLKQPRVWGSRVSPAQKSWGLRMIYSKTFQADNFLFSGDLDDMFARETNLKKKHSVIGLARYYLNDLKWRHGTHRDSTNTFSHFHSDHCISFGLNLTHCTNLKPGLSMNILFATSVNKLQTSQLFSLMAGTFFLVSSCLAWLCFQRVNCASWHCQQSAHTNNL